MIKKTGKIILTTLIMSCMALVSCGYEPIFYGIMNDVAPEAATVSGNITSIARCNVNGEEYLFLTGNGSLLYKKNSSSKHGDWSTYPGLPFELHHYNYFSTPENGHEGQQILKVISDKDNLYILTASFTTDTQYGIVLPQKFYLWSKALSNIFAEPNAGWKNLTEGYENQFYVTAYDTNEGEFNTFFNIFSTNSPKPEHRKAYFWVTKVVDTQVVNEYYLLNGQTDFPPQKDTSVGQTNYVQTLEGNTRVNSAFYVGDTLYFSDSLVVTTNETFEDNATYACLGAVSQYYNSTNKILLFDTTQTTEVLTSGSTIASLALTKDYLIIGKGSYSSSYTTDGGIERAALQSDGKPENKLSEFTDNAKYQFTSAYIVMTLLCADPSKTEDQACIYASISYRGTGSSSSASPNDVGLWSYYPSRGNWNRE